MHEACGGVADRLSRFDLGEGTPHPAGETRLQARHLTLRLALWPEERRFEGDVTLKLDVVGSGIEELVLDAAELDLRDVEVDGRQTPFRYFAQQLRVAFRQPPQPGSQLTVRVRYARRDPRFGLFFLAPDAAAPDRPNQVWTQGQDDYTRYWLPCLDSPNQKCTSEVTVEVPEIWEVISNGRLLDVANLAHGRRSFRWAQELPHSPYLISVVAGEFASWHEQRDGVSLSYHVPRGREADGRRAFAHTPEIFALFTNLTGCPYPWAKYSQVCVADFIFGGMENTSATTLTDRTLHDERGNLDQTSDSLVAHELAHQWFGDLVTCRSWAHGWLNEGFATYYEHLWTEHHLGRDEFQEELLSSIEAYLGEDHGRYRRPIVEDRYQSAAELFDRHLYEKGAVVLHQLRRELGDSPFFASVRRYLEENLGGTVETIDLARAIERTTGRNLDLFFRQWLFRPGHPELEASISLSGSRATLRLRQTQTEEPFAFPLQVGIEQQGKLERFAVRVGAREERFDFALQTPPTFVALDPDLDLLASWSIQKPEELWVAELGSPLLPAIARSRAAQAIGRAQLVGAVTALRERLHQATFWGEQARVAAALGELRGPTALSALAEAVGLAHPKARRAVVRALGQFRDRAAVEALEPLARRDASYLVEGEALKALARTRQPGTRATVLAALDRPSDQGIICKLALEGLGESRDREALPAVRARLAPAEPVAVRVAATLALAKLGEQNAEVLDALMQLTEDHDFYVRIAACQALGELGEPSARGALERLSRRDPSGRVQRAAREAMARLSNKDGNGLRGELDELRAEVARLRAEVARSAPGDPLSPPPKPKRGAKPAAKRQPRKRARRSRV